MTSRNSHQTVTITLMQTKIHCRKHTSTKQLSRDQTSTLQRRVTQQYKYKQQTTCSQKINPTKATNRKDRKHSKEARQLASTQRVNGKDK